VIGYLLHEQPAVSGQVPPAVRLIVDAGFHHLIGLIFGGFDLTFDIAQAVEHFREQDRTDGN
jgi:hypothetical protein